MSKPRYRSLAYEYTCSDYASSAPVQFTYKELQQETKGFKEKIGEGGLGSVYKGVLANKMAVAVERSKGIVVGAYEEFEKGNVGADLDRRLVEDDIDAVQAMRLLKVSFWCIQEHASFRPTMGKVVQMIEGIADVKKPPPPLFTG
ncbi:hypothetical protein SASPL_150194 [Salvia splendens]|uniref:Pto-interacting protein 1 n=1 Tax=Salvia splendens TaxID=180675 RepID=A0A8X8W650_SALSN|nr:hypothetical protein SASPL_150194 [Salvia splendens]